MLSSLIPSPRWPPIKIWQIMTSWRHSLNLSLYPITLWGAKFLTAFYGGWLHGLTVNRCSGGGGCTGSQGGVVVKGTLACAHAGWGLLSNGGWSHRVVLQAAVQWGVVAQVHRVVSLSSGGWSCRLTGRGGLERDLSTCGLKGRFVSGKKSI